MRLIALKVVNQLRNLQSQKLENCLSPQNWLSPKNSQKVEIYLILVPLKLSQAS